MSDQDENFLNAIQDFFNIGDGCMTVLIAVAWAEPMQDNSNGRISASVRRLLLRCMGRAHAG